MADSTLPSLQYESAASSSGIQRFLNPALDLDDARARLRAGEMVVLRNAFVSEFAEATHAALSDPSFPWTQNEAYFDDGYSFCHSNVYDRSRWPHALNATFSVFNDEATKQWVEELSGRECAGVPIGSPSNYRPGDYSLPHSDWMGQRTVAYVWHLSKDWRPEWGGGLYWAQNRHNQRIYPASFNTLVLFLVTPSSSHFVTPVSRHAAGQRLAFNGWWQSDYLPRRLDGEARLTQMLATREARSAITAAQAAAIGDLLDSGGGGGGDCSAEIARLCDDLEDEIIDACGPEVLLRKLVHRS